MPKLLYTHQREAARLASDELARFGITTIKNVSDETSLAESTVDMFSTRRPIHDNPPVFVRHICPVDYSFAWSVPDSQIYSAALSLLESASVTGKSVGVQARSVCDVSTKPKREVLDAVYKALDESKAERANGTPELALSVVMTDDEVMFGLSKAPLNLSAFAGGNRSFKRDENLISRSEFKLLEAFEVFDINISQTNGYALDLGSAPGGWSRVLANKGFSVVSVDPAELDARLEANQSIKHVRATAQQFLTKLEHSAQSFDILVNDMKMESSLSSRLVSQFAPFLASDAPVILTLKLLPGKYLRQIYNARKILESRFEILGVRQLFHNRNEVTVYLRKRMSA